MYTAVYKLHSNTLLWLLLVLLLLLLRTILTISIHHTATSYYPPTMI
jgi:hypothetical protein